MWTFPPAILGNAGGGVGSPTDSWTLVTELLFEDSPDTGVYVNTAGRGPPTYNNYVDCVLSSAQAHQGVQSCKFNQGVFDSQNNIASVGIQDLTISTADFRFSFWLYLTTYSARWGQGLFAFATVGSVVSPRLYLDSVNGYLHYDNTIAAIVDTTTAPGLNAWHEIKVERISNLTTVYCDSVSAGSATDNNDYSVGSSLRIGSFGNIAGGLVTAYIDEFRIYNGNI